MAKHPGGRPRQGERAKLAPLNMRTDPKLREAIEKAAADTGRSMTQELERRVKMTFDMEKWLGGPHIHALVNALGSTIHNIELLTGERWTDDAGTWDAVEGAARRLLAWKRPPRPDEQTRRLAFEKLDETAAAMRKAAADLDAYRIDLGVASANGFADIYREAGRGISGSPILVELRADWTDDQRQAEAALQVVFDQAMGANGAALAEVQRIMKDDEERRGRANRMGEDEAQAMYAAVGPLG